MLTYDDGPGKRFTPKLLDLLAQHEARATFYLVGFRADDAPQLVERTIAAGHEIGNHGYWHRNAWRVLPWRSMRDVRDGFRALSKRSTRPMTYRPPFGNLTTWSWLTARSHHAPVYWWTCDGRDQSSSIPDPSVVVHEVTKAGGGVVLMHSHDSGEHREQYVLELTKQLLHAAGVNGWKVCTISALTGGGAHWKGEAAA